MDKKTPQNPQKIEPHENYQPYGIHRQNIASIFVYFPQNDGGGPSANYCPTVSNLVR